MALKQKTVYFREEDVEKWKAIKNKAEWLHEHLNATKWSSGGVDVKKAQPGTIDPISGLEIDEFRFTVPEVQKYVDELLEPKLTPPENTA